MNRDFNGMQTEE